MDSVRVLRVIEYTGERSLIEDLISESIHGERRYKRFFKGVNGEVVIKAATLGLYPEILENKDGQKD